MTSSAQELITLTNQKQKMGTKESFVEKNQRIEVKLCKDCKYYRKEWTAHIFTLTHIYDTCACPHTSQNLVTGNEDRYCYILRAEKWKLLDHSCGPEAKYFEAK